jgi:Ca2+-binding EF-hand superfamily protein
MSAGAGRRNLGARLRSLAAILSAILAMQIVVGVCELGTSASAATASTANDGCMSCHAGIEEMHPEAGLSCVDCHGGDGAARTKAQAHPQRTRRESGDERVAGLTEDLAWRRFENPMDLRVAPSVCGPCHEGEVRRVRTSLHATTAGHLSDGYYESGASKRRGSLYGVFAVPAGQAQRGDIDELLQVPPFRESGPREELSTHFGDLVRKECMQCHLWSEGRAVEGRVGFDGDYRGEGCAACHVSYALDGLSESGDRSAPKAEPGHPRAHVMTRAPTTDTCTSCHYGDATIGLNFRGLSQLPPGAPGGPEIPGTTDVLLNRQFYLDDPSLVPPDVHHEKGMHCIDCHTENDAMGDGRLYGAMEHAVETSCTDCHGTFDAVATLRTQRGTPLAHVRRKDGKVVLTSKVDGREHDVPQVVHVLDPKRPEFNEKAARAMTGEHARLACHLCHSAWNPNFMGFHFDRNESLTQLDLLSGQRTKGRVTTQEKVFSSWKSFYAGLDESGRFAPYLTGFSTMGTVRDGDGRVILDQELPVTVAGLSGLTQIHHQMHTIRGTSRACVECHRSSATWGLGSVNFRLGRQLAFVADRRGLEVLAIDRAQVSASVPIAKFVQPDIVDLALDCDPLQGFARRVFVAEGYRGVHVLDVGDPAAPARIQFFATVQPMGLAWAGEHLYVADGAGGVRVLRSVDGGRLSEVARVPTFDARDIHVQWPYAYVADGIGGVLVLDVRKPAEPKVVSGARVSSESALPDAAVAVSVLFQNSRPIAEDGRVTDKRTIARALLCVLDEREGLVMFNATEPSALEKLWPPAEERSRVRRNAVYRGMVVRSHVDLAEQQGGSKTREGDFVYLLSEVDVENADPQSRLSVVEVTEPRRVRSLATLPSGDATEMLALGAYYNPPFLASVALAPGSDGLYATDVSVSAEPKQLGVVAGLRECYAVALEEFPLDRMIDEAGRPLKDVSHVGSRWLTMPEIERLLLVPSALLGNSAERPKSEVPGAGARAHFAACDVDRSGVLEGDEVRRAGAALDADGDGRILLRELAALARLKEGDRTESEPAAPVFLETRVDRDGDLARLFDGVSPLEFDVDGNRRLDRAELSRILFAALDLDGDRALAIDELSRHPGDLRQLRYGGLLARERLARLDANGDGRIQAKELRISDEDFLALDVDRSGFVDLGPEGRTYWETRGHFSAGSEWPSRRAVALALPPRVSVEALLATFDSDRDGALGARDLKGRSELFTELDTDRDGSAEPDELAARVRLIEAQGVEAAPDRFVERWDLDGDGQVSDKELPEVAWRVLARRRR